MIDLAIEGVIQRLVNRGIHDQTVLKVFRKVSRKTFVPEYLHHRAYGDDPLPIGLGQTVSPPYAIARILQEARASQAARVLEIGTGSGYQTALLSAMVDVVYTVEYLPELSARARKVLCDDLGVSNVQFRVADGFQGWSDEAPFDAIVVNCAADEVPWPLIGQLKVGARLAMPIGDKEQTLKVVVRQDYDEEEIDLSAEALGGTFSRMVGEVLED